MRDGFVEVDLHISKFRTHMLNLYADKFVEDDTLTKLNNEISTWSIATQEKWANLETLTVKLLDLESPMFSIIIGYAIKGDTLCKRSFRIPMQQHDVVKPIITTKGKITTLVISREMLSHQLRQICNGAGFNHSAIDTVQLCLKNGMVINDLPEISVILFNSGETLDQSIGTNDTHS